MAPQPQNEGKNERNETMNIEIANPLVTLRKKNGLSQEQLAAKLGLSRQAVSKWENKVSHSKSNTKITR